MPSGIADYSAELLPVFAETAPVDAVCPPFGRFRWRLRPPEGIPVVDVPVFRERVRSGVYDAVFYHLGNNPWHEFVYDLALRIPGIVVFHDFVMHHLIAHVMVEAGWQPERYRAVAREEYGERGVRMADLRLQGVATDYEKFLFPMNGHIARRSRAIVVHSEDSRDKMLRVAPDKPVWVVPHHAGQPPAAVAAADRAEARRRLGLPADAFLVGHFGFITRPKQPAAVVGGFARLVERHPDAQLVLTGADNTGGGLEQLLRTYGVADSVRLAGYVDLDRFYLYLKAVDVVINLRYPSAGESSGTFARALAEGRATIVNDLGSFGEIPGDIALKVQIDGDQAEQVGAHLLRLAEDAAFRAEVEDRARRYAERFLDQRRCRDLYLDVARLVADRVPVAASVGDGRVRSAGDGEATGAPEVRDAPPPSGSPPPARDAATAMEHLSRSRPDVEALVASTLPPSGAATYLDLVYRLLLRRPAEEEALRSGQLAMAASYESRTQLVREVLESREFHEIELIEDKLKELAGDRREFTMERGEAFAPNTTERVVEIPWVLSRWRGEQRVLDVGYAFASGVYLSALLALPAPAIHGVDMAAANVPGLVRTRADVRALPYRDQSFDLVICISTIEHIGRDNTHYGLPQERDLAGDVATLRELERILVPGGRLLITVPFGRAEEHHWFVQYDPQRWRDLVAASGFWVQEQQPFRLTDRGWERFDDLTLARTLAYRGDGAPAAQGLLCASLSKRP